MMIAAMKACLEVEKSVCSGGWCRPAYPSVVDRISTEIGRQYGSLPVFLRMHTQSFQKVQKSRDERM